LFFFFDKTKVDEANGGVQKRISFARKL